MSVKVLPLTARVREAGSGWDGRVLLLGSHRRDTDELGRVIAAVGFVPLLSGLGQERSLGHDATTAAVVIGPGSGEAATLRACRTIRRADQVVPILVVGERAAPATVARLFEAGADDFIAWPVNAVEFVARLGAHIRKSRALAPAQRSLDVRGAARATRTRRFGDIEVDVLAREVRLAGVPLTLGALEYKLIEYLSLNQGVAVSWDQIAHELYGYDSDAGTERIEILVRRLRAKLSRSGSRTNVVAVPGYGYRWIRTEEARDRSGLAA
jgi:two-component system, OmpR family, response regulator